jgi:glycosyltransferase involved in cell wall biosynthesis
MDKDGLSIIVPVMNEEESGPTLAQEVSDAMVGLDREWECLWINDGSTDRTLDVMRDFANEDRHHRVIDLDGNFGQSAALAYGFTQAKMPLLATLDGDGQNVPADLVKMLTVMDEQDVDMVNGIRAKRQDSKVRLWCSKLANGFRNNLTGESVTDVGCAIRVFKREHALRIPVFRGMHRFFPTLLRLEGARITEMPVQHRSREVGVTKYGINNRLWVGIADTFGLMWWKRRSVRPRGRHEGS